MIDKTGGVDRIFGVHFNSKNKIGGADPEQQSSKKDDVTISTFSTLVERGRALALALPDVRIERVAQARAALNSGSGAESVDIASAIINAAVKGI